MLLLYLCLSLLALAGAQSDCHDQGGWCGDAAFDDCDDGDWDYGIDCDPSFQTCCINPNPTTTESTTVTSTSSTTTDPGNTTSPGPPTGCGWRPAVVQEVPQIVGGYESVPHSWPWMVSLELDYFGWGDWVHHCGGSLIAPQWILTAAHCIAKSGADGPENFRVILGMHYQTPSEQDGEEIYMDLDSYYVHPEYDTEVDGAPSDVSLIKLVSPITVSERMSPVCLPTHFGQNFTGQDECFITGWGLTKDTSPEGVLNESPINVITNDLCDYKWEIGSGRVGLIKDSHICAGDGVPGTCNGDSGGPLNCKHDGLWYIAGATSFGAAGCVAEGAPDVYTRLSHFVDWITTTMDNN